LAQYVEEDKSFYEKDTHIAFTHCAVKITNIRTRTELNIEGNKMMKQSKDMFKDEKGFTLVELAIVMIIIGLLIGGVLKGQELVSNAQVTATISQIKGIDAAVSTFNDKYNALPGDIPNAGVRIPNCTAENSCLPGGGDQGNRRIDGAPDAAQDNEAIAFFVQLSKSDLITGITSSRGNVFGGTLPASDVNGGFHIGYSRGTSENDFANIEDITDVRAGHYLVMTGIPRNAIGNESVNLTPNQAQRIDTKLDDGNGDDGSVRAYHGGVSNSCSSAGVYVEANTSQVCGLYVRIQE